MTREMIWEAVKRSINEVLPDLATFDLSQKNSLRNLGANSVERAEIIMLTLAQLKLKIPMVEFAQAKDIEELVEFFYRHHQSQTQSQG
ncbi:MAG: acyl carrier protein [Alphaproteobacteria bacterium]|nr:acyl carrier protein [Alphaproteobacteria bacterium]